MSEWRKFVKEQYDDMKKTNPNTKFGDALKAAAKRWKKSKKSKKGGNDQNEGEITAQRQSQQNDGGNDSVPIAQRKSKRNGGGDDIPAQRKSKRRSGKSRRTRRR